MTQLDDDLARLVHDDPPHTGVVDTARLIHTGSRLRRRRQLVVIAGAGLAAAVVVAPFALLGGNNDTVGISPADSPHLTTSSATPSDIKPASIDELQKRVENREQVCGVMACQSRSGRYGSPEEGEVIGAQLEMGVFDGNTEVLYAARTEGFDTMTGEPKDSVDVISSGIVVDGRLRRTVWAFQPNEDPRRPIFLYGGERTVTAAGQAHFGAFGVVEGEHAEITATSDGQTRPVSGLSTEVYPGYTLFYDTAAWNEDWGFKAEVTYGVPGGAACSLEECGTVG